VGGKEGGMKEERKKRGRKEGRKERKKKEYTRISHEHDSRYRRSMGSSYRGCVVRQ
jgi:hypothetical protein